MNVVFNSCVQNPGETVDGYVNRLRKFASSCAFGTLMDDVIQDKLVTGLTDTATTIERAGTRYKQSATYCPFQGSRKPCS